MKTTQEEGNMAAKEEAATGSVTADKQSGAVLFELENVAVKGRQIVCKVLQRVLAAKDVEVTPLIFCRYYLGSSMESFLTNVLESAGKTRLSKEKLALEIKQGIDKAFSNGDIALDSGLKDVMAVADKRGALSGVLSGFAIKEVQALLEKLALTERVAQVVSYSGENSDAPSADAWLRLARNMSVVPGCCVAIVTSSASCKAALKAGMRLVAVPDDFTASQDFGGADFVLDTLDAGAVESIFDLMEQPL